VKCDKVVTSVALAGVRWGQTCMLKSKLETEKVSFQPRFECRQRVAVGDKRR